MTDAMHTWVTWEPKKWQIYLLCCFAMLFMFWVIIEYILIGIFINLFTQAHLHIHTYKISPPAQAKETSRIAFCI